MTVNVLNGMVTNGKVAVLAAVLAGIVTHEIIR